MTSLLLRVLRRTLGLGAKLVMTAAFMAYLLLARSFLYVLTLYVAVYFLPRLQPGRYWCVRDSLPRLRAG